MNLIGKSLKNRYYIISLLGEGGMAQVYVANDVIAKSIDVTCEEYTVDEARAKGAHGIFDSKYGEKVKVYIIGDVDKQICGGPHAKNTADLHHFKITKEESSSSGIRRIKAILD